MRGVEGLTACLLPNADKIGGWFVRQVGSLGMMPFHFLHTLISAPMLYMNGEAADEGVRRFAWRLAGARGESANGRVPQMPTRRWITIQAKELAKDQPSSVPTTIQERAWSSHIRRDHGQRQL